MRRDRLFLQLPELPQDMKQRGRMPRRRDGATHPTTPPPRSKPPGKCPPLELGDVSDPSFDRAHSVRIVWR